MNFAWKVGISSVLLAVPLACSVTVNPDADGLAGSSGSSGSSGSGGSSGSAGSAGTSGAAGSAVAGGGGSAGTGGEGGTGADPFPAPTCEAEAADADDECRQCLKQTCCDAWLGCDDAECLEQVLGVSSCMLETDFPDSAEYEICVSENTAPMEDFLLETAGTVLDCANEMTTGADAGAGFTRCGVACFGDDIFF